MEYRGGFQADKFHGIGILLMRDGFMFKGSFEKGYPVEGLSVYANGDQYTGPLSKDRLRHGYGVLNYADGSQYSGEF